MQEKDWFVGHNNPESESSRVLISRFRDQIESNLKEAEVSPDKVRGARIIPVVPDKKIVNFLGLNPNFEMKVAVVSLTDKPIPEVDEIPLNAEDLYYGEVYLDMLKDFACDEPLFVIKQNGRVQGYQASVNYKGSIKPALHFTERSDIPLGTDKTQKKGVRIENEGLLAFFWDPDRGYNLVGSIVMPQGFEEQLKESGIMNDNGNIADSVLHFEKVNTDGIEITVRSAAEIRTKLEKKYSWILPHYRMWKSPQPDPLSQLAEYRKWERSRKVIECVLGIGDHDFYELDDTDELTSCEAATLLGDMEDFQLQSKLDRLMIPILDRLNNMVEEREKRHFVESPTNAKQTLRAVRQIDKRLSEVIPRDTGPFGFDPVEDELESLLESGKGFQPDGSYLVFTGEETERIQRRIGELNRDIPVVDPASGLREELEAKRQKWLSLLPKHVRAKYESET